MAENDEKNTIEIKKIERNNDKEKKEATSTLIKKKQLEKTVSTLSPEKKAESIHSIRYQKIKAFLDSILENHIFIGFMTILTLYALFGDDIRILSTDKDGDKVFYGFSSFCLAAFALENDYIFGFFFWLDVVSTVSLIFDIGWINDALFGTGGAANAQNAAQLARAGRASRVGTKAGRIVRIVRLIRLVKLYKHAQYVLEEKAAKEARDELEKVEKDLKNVAMMSPSGYAGSEMKSMQQPSAIIKGTSANNNELPIPEDNVINVENRKSIANKGEGKGKEEEIFKETNVGKKLSDLTTRRVIMLVMSIMISIPIFSLDTYVEEYTSYESGLRILSETKAGSSTSQKFLIAKSTYIADHSQLRNPLIYLVVKGGVDFQSAKINYNYLRSSEIQQYNYQETTYAFYDISADYKLNAILGIIRTIFVCFVLTVGALYFSKDANDLVLQPIEVMLEKVKKIGENPLEAAQMEEAEALAKAEVDKLEAQEDEKC